MPLIPTFLCPKSWEGMSGDETTRVCAHCQKVVHNLSALSVDERLALLSSPAASVCGRYRVAIRRPARGRETAYWRHLVRYGAGVAVAGSALLVLWELESGKDPLRHFRAVAPGAGTKPMPPELYVERKVHLLGEVEYRPQKSGSGRNPGERPPDHVDVKLDPNQLGGEWNEAPATAAATPKRAPDPSR